MTSNRQHRHGRTLTSIMALTMAAPTILAQSARYIYLWQPHTGTELSATDQDLLTQLLQNAELRQYQLKPGDNLDLIVGRLFLVQTKQAAAFKIYSDTVRNLNPNASWRAGESITVPVGPQFGGRYLPASLQQVHDEAFRRLSHYAVRWTRDEEFSTKTQDSISRQWRWLLDDYQTKSRDTIVRELAGLGVVGPVQERNPVKFRWWAQLQTVPLRKPINGALIASLPIPNDPVVPCTQPCTPCARRIGQTTPAAPSVRVLIEDTGLDPHIPGAYPHRLYPITANNDAPALLADDSPEQHGTYIYQELLQTGGGLLTPDNLYVAKVSKGNIFDLSATFNAIQAMVLVPAASTAGVIVANVSAAGTIGKPSDPPPQIPALGQEVLMIAAAGNDYRPIDEERHIYGQFGGPETPVILVGALANDDSTPTAYSSFSKDHVHLLAQGDCVCGSPNRSLSGTSQAAPIVTTAAAILASEHSTWTVSDIKWRLISTGDRQDPEWTARSLGGRLNAQRARQSGIHIMPKTGEPTITTAVRLDSAWRDEWQTFSEQLRQDDTKDSNGAFLRLTDAKTNGTATCFRVLRYRRLPTDASFCVPNTAELRPKGGSPISAEELQDLILPLPGERRICGDTIKLGGTCP